MTNSWNIPALLASEIRDRDTICVYCRVKFGSDGTRKTAASWEHIVNDALIITRENIALCCISCNASKGTKELSVWLRSDYCKTRGITEKTVADVVRRALSKPPTLAADCE